MNPKLELIVLGSGAFAPSKNPKQVRNPSGYALKLPGEILLFDFGFGNLRQMARVGLDPAQVSHLFITHRHLDHLGDLPAILFHFHYDTTPKKRHLTLCGPKGFISFFKNLQKTYSPWISPKGYRLSVREMKTNSTLRGRGWMVRTLSVPHSTEAVAYRFEGYQKSFCYTGDTAYDPRIACFAYRADLFALECTLPGPRARHGHMTVSQALHLAQESKSSKSLLTHLSEESLRALKGYSLPKGKTNILVARDLQRIAL
ncbi:MAG: MBL fold metallo-hydrolase [Elusimicrobia bacterium]|nr:MBL fold metallo-hydrolase [Elusimicrobiota bacterium]